MCSLIYRSWYRRRSEGSHASGDAELSKTPLSAWARGCCRCVIVIASQLLRKCNTCDSKCIFHCHKCYACVIIAP